MKKLILLLICLTAILIFQNNVWAGGKGGPAPAPRYYTFEDLREEIRQQTFQFANAQKPDSAMVNLGFFSFYPASYNSYYTALSRVRSNPTKYRAKAYRPLANWIDNPEIKFDWNNFSLKGGSRGDLVFLRGNSVASNFVKMFSQWTHVAIVNAPDRKEVFESMPEEGVKRRYAPSSWDRITYYTCKKVNGLSYQKIWDALDFAIRRYENISYFPQLLKSDKSFLRRWSDKNDLSSMYCSKLIYNIFKDRVNLDTDNTIIYFLKDLQNKEGTAPPESWIGVSPDDIYYSYTLGADYAYSDKLKRL